MKLQTSGLSSPFRSSAASLLVPQPNHPHLVPSLVVVHRLLRFCHIAIGRLAAAGWRFQLKFEIVLGHLILSVLI
ncbi:unnamed protein product [Citrullus colocynthis]|uniref:Uncharacterized protein n=1 Tax=Citrullus colocynthis TaxID=252529 RepID=A0ABP0Y5D4_9ROSI